MKILVTGGLGFIGSNFILKLLHGSDKYHIINVDAELYGSNIKNISEIKDSSNSGMSYGKYTNLRNNPPSPINIRKTIGFFVEFSSVSIIFNFVDNLRSL